MTGDAQHPFDFDALRERIERIRRKDLFFVGGIMKAGTTWLQLMLDAHPEIACRGEGHFTSQFLPALARCYTQYGRIIDDKNRTIFKEIEGFPLPTPEHLHYVGVAAMLLMLGEYADRDTVKAVGEKTPDTMRAMGMLRSVFPQAKFINIVRDGRDVAVSAWFHNLRVTPDWAMETFGGLEKFCDHYAPLWQRDVEAARAFAEAHPDQVLEMTYEGLHGDARREVTRMLEFLGRDSSEACVDRCLEAGRFEQLAKGRRTGEEDRGSHFRKGVVGDWRNHLDEASAARFAERAKGWLARMGYE